MNLFWAALIVVLVAVIATTAMLLVRRRAPAGSYFEDGDRAAGVFGVLATGFAVLLGFVVFLAFQSFDTSRSGAESEAEIIAEEFETAQLMPAAVRGRFSGELICYARSVVRQEWPQMESGTLAGGHNPWGVAMFRTLKMVEPRSAAEQAAYAKWLDQRVERESARVDRTHGAEGVIPTPLWIVLFLSALAIFGFMLFFADSSERVIVQGTMMGSVAVVISSTLLLLWFLDHPYSQGVGGLRPVAMQRTVEQLTHEQGIADRHFQIPCDEQGARR
jgi:hypothetical protein